MLCSCRSNKVKPASLWLHFWTCNHLIVRLLLNSDNIRSLVKIENSWETHKERERTRDEVIVWFIQNVNVSALIIFEKKSACFCLRFHNLWKTRTKPMSHVKSFLKGSLSSKALMSVGNFSKRNRREKLQANESETLQILIQRLISRYNARSNFPNWSQWFIWCLSKYLQQIEIDKNL